MEKQEHTPLPWTTMEFENSIDLGNYEGDNVYDACSVSFQGGNDELDVENAKLILKGVNFHQKLVDALTTMEAYLGFPYHDEPVVIKAREVLAELKAYQAELDVLGKQILGR
jgi:hypothetical protein